MADYGHELAFGTFITPQSARPQEAVALARLTERAGLDLATFQDHPYQPAFLDTWTLLSWVAAQTETLRVAPNVLNLPLRQPAVAARAAASLDLLSGGRFELGLGAGAFWEGVEAMGGARRTPGEAVDALDEAIDVIRGVWDADARGGVRVDGEHYRVQGAKRGPAPAHDVEIWLGAYKPRMLRLTGRKADGWLPSLPYLPREQIAPANAAIDEAARAAGRDPREIRRLLNIKGGFGPAGSGFLQGPPEQWVEELVELVREHGFSTFLVMGDEPRLIETFGAEVAPAVREAVARERAAAGTSTAPVRGPQALAERRPGIDYEAVPPSLAAEAVEPGDRAYRSVRSSYVHRGSPGLVLRPRDAEQAREALVYAREQDVPLAVRSGGHGISGRSTDDGGVVIDLGRLDEVTLLDPATGRVRLGPGARWGDVARELGRHGLGISSGDYGDVGVGGLATAGGIGLLVRRHGLTIDHVVAAEMVLADGSRVRADAEERPDLLWAVRGAGGNFGIVTGLELEAYPVGDVVLATTVYDASEAAALLTRWGAAIERAPRELTSFITVVNRGRGPAFAQAYSVYAGDDAQAAADALAPLLEAGPVLDQRAHLLPYPNVIPPHGGDHVGGGLGGVRAGLLDHLDAPAAEALARLLGSGEVPLLQVRSVGGAVNDVAPLATAYAHRSQQFSANAVGRSAARLDELWDAELLPLQHGLYLSFDTDRRPERLHDAFPEPTLARLRELKARYDPDQLFDRNFPIPPSGTRDHSSSKAMLS
ncbi:LLM class flavin-dependent oxidoreductase [Conexibacter arvalis]|uniref:Alkanesulfonate monooxygenase SsuD/methylene tetrahydromethanopterin reductase-like flavin-dependent oxidoreductase (Luciferase family)/FAD/FMN-containing dehydrogenase n=1 Tax=Conexibacter arvalis TaxID=912552 RepID=A0A840ILI1_9ACTN|nr:LLM class flavin-dependent oxidoreductase [Conexibacter arvalis]MBB4664760.1 alkanesulfonate monooxygenase SsuD/methylene tetrahydromethanopterin reductase-like flavin-dependent oxidoreductase (luciferase family)/FAD/FMN-containing dehydrogenase [Conexibacter arvalis]